MTENLVQLTSLHQPRATEMWKPVQAGLMLADSETGHKATGETASQAKAVLADTQNSGLGRRERPLARHPHLMKHSQNRGRSARSPLTQQVRGSCKTASSACLVCKWRLTWATNPTKATKAPTIHRGRTWRVQAVREHWQNCRPDTWFCGAFLAGIQTDNRGHGSKTY